MRALFPEKAFAASLDEARAVVAAATANNVVINMGTLRRYEHGYLLRPIYMEYLYVEFVCKCIYVYLTYILDGEGTMLPRSSYSLGSSGS